LITTKKQMDGEKEGKKKDKSLTTWNVLEKEIEVREAFEKKRPQW